MDSTLKLNQKLLCQQCIEYFESDFTKVIGYKKVIQKIEENRKKSFDIIDNLITKNIKKIELF